MGAKFKSIATGAVVLALVAAFATLLVLFIFTEAGGAQIAVGAFVAVFVAVIGYFILNSAAAEHSAEIKKEANHIAQSAAEIADGNFKIMQNTAKTEEFAQIEKALTQICDVQRDLVKDIENITRCHMQGNISEIIDESRYDGEYRKTVKEINTTLQTYAEYVAAITEMLNETASGNYDTRPPSMQGRQADKGIELLKNKLKLLEADFEKLQNAMDIAKNENMNLNAEINNLKGDINTLSAEKQRLLSDNNSQSMEINRLNTDKNRLENRLRSMPNTSLTTRAAPVATNNAAASPSNRPTLRPITDSAPPVKSIKIVVPSGTHEYDRKDYGKY